MRCSLSWCAGRGLDPLSASRVHLELYIRWMLVAAGALIAACMGLNNARAFTECTPSGLRARTVLGRLRGWPWPQVASISVKEVTARGGTYSAVMVTTTAGRRIRLAAPTSGILTPEEFTASVKQIEDYWRAATAATGQRSEP